MTTIMAARLQAEEGSWDAASGVFVPGHLPWWGRLMAGTKKLLRL